MHDFPLCINLFKHFLYNLLHKITLIVNQLYRFIILLENLKAIMQNIVYQTYPLILVKGFA